MTPQTHPAFGTLATSWELALSADAYAPNTLKAYGAALAQLTGWLGEHHADVGPHEVRREHIRAWIVHVRETRSSSSARGWFAGVRHFFRFLVAEEVIDTDPTDGIKTPPAGEPLTPVLAEASLKRLLDACTGKGFVPRRDAAVLRIFIDGGLRLAELHGLRVADVDLRERMLYVVGKGSRRSGPRHRAVPVGVKTAQALDRYLRERARHPHQAQPALWLGDRDRGPVTADAIDAMLRRRGAGAGMPELHPHQLRHTWASAFRSAGGSEGNLMVLGGWRSRAMLDRYGRAAATDRAREEYQRLSLGDRL